MPSAGKSSSRVINTYECCIRRSVGSDASIISGCPKGFVILFQPKLKIYRIIYHSALNSIVVTFRIELSEAQRVDALLVFYIRHLVISIVPHHPLLARVQSVCCTHDYLLFSFFILLFLIFVAYFVKKIE